MVLVHCWEFVSILLGFAFSSTIFCLVLFCISLSVNDFSRYFLFFIVCSLQIQIINIVTIYLSVHTDHSMTPDLVSISCERGARAHALPSLSPNYSHFLTDTNKQNNLKQKKKWLSTLCVH